LLGPAPRSLSDSFLTNNGTDFSGLKALSLAIAESGSLSLTSIDLNDHLLGAKAGQAIAEAISASGSLTSVK
jgi:hypothetical protein